MSSPNNTKIIIKAVNADEKIDSKAILVSSKEVVLIRKNKIENWTNLADVWSLKYGFYGLGLSNILTNTAIIYMYKKRFNIKGKQKYLTSILPILTAGVLPSVFSSLSLNAYFTPKLLKANNNECFFCHEVKSILGHIAIGSIIPTGIAWLQIYQTADVLKSITTPRSTLLLESKGRKVYFKHFKNIFYQTNKNVYGYLLANYMIQFFLCSFVLFYQQMQFRETIEPLEFSLNEIERIKKMSQN